MTSLIPSFEEFKDYEDRFDSHYIPENLYEGQDHSLMLYSMSDRDIVNMIVPEYYNGCSSDWIAENDNDFMRFFEEARN